MNLIQEKREETISKKLLCELDVGTEFDFFGNLPIAGDQSLLLKGFLDDAKAVTLVPNVRAGVTIPTRAQQKYHIISYPMGRMLYVDSPTARSFCRPAAHHEEPYSVRTKPTAFWLRYQAACPTTPSW
uniref:Uncharacterized protein n=1 Tax=Romanomermis culicivorax TaxID=13658 RepID=A0A915HQ32_ROMCU